MRADRIDVSWDDQRSKWLVRIQAGEEVIRRYCDLPKSVDENTLRSSALQTVKDEGYEVEYGSLKIERPAA